MPCHSCLLTDQCSSSRALQIQGAKQQNAVAPRQSFAFPFRAPFRFRKGFPLRTRFRRFHMQVSTQDRYWEREEARWLREEERWKREEQRWIREERRWNSERENLTAEVNRLKLELEKLQTSQNSPERLEYSASLRDVLTGLKNLLQSANKTAEITESQVESSATAGQASAPKLVTEQSVESIKFVLPLEDSKETTSSKSGATKAAKNTKAADGSNKRTLKKGSEGDNVKLLQEALAKLGFYSGEEDMEYSSFSNGTDRAVKSWQASIGVPEDGIVTAQILAQLVSEQGVLAVNSAAVVKTSPESETSSTSISEARVYLLGENRWEEPERLLRKRRENIPTAQKCFTCKGEGRTLCSDCEGTGELNVEEQFLEWAGEGAKCPYCEGSGTLICDDCDGKGIAVK